MFSHVLCRLSHNKSSWLAFYMRGSWLFSYIPISRIHTVALNPWRPQRPARISRDLCVLACHEFCLLSPTPQWLPAHLPNNKGEYARFIFVGFPNLVRSEGTIPKTSLHHFRMDEERIMCLPTSLVLVCHLWLANLLAKMMSPDMKVRGQVASLWEYPPAIKPDILSCWTNTFWQD